MIDESSLTKGQIRKLNALRKSVGEKIGNKAFLEWQKSQKRQTMKTKTDFTAQKLRDALNALADDRKLNLGTYGYTIRRSKGRGATGFVITKNTGGVPK